MNIETVNELIQSLESAGELSIKERKYLELAKAYLDVAAENVALKSFGDKLNDMHNALNGEGTGIQGRAEVACQQVALEAAMEEFNDIKTPATDRIVAGIKADGVEEFVSNTVHKIFDESEAVSALSYLSLANSHVKQLREGADK
ncbi:hypothetical protein [Klebsiella pasteurii]|uniref:hypothetical protein n=1 Tax=Klebsiella pasteurii TaxID=2587529 RepID=UPI001C7D0B05|nr:hypothetical protein [Klebsiella pasteurii]